MSIYITEDLGRNMPHVDSLKTITADDHFRNFFAYIKVDVWTADGWLITAVQNDGIRHHVRKGVYAGVIEIDPTVILYHT